MGSPGAGGSLSNADDVSFNPRVIGDLMYYTNVLGQPYWSNVPLSSLAAQVDKGGLEKVYTPANPTGSYQINVANGNVHYVTLGTGGGAITFSFASPPANAGKAVSCTLYVVQSSPVKTVTWPSTSILKWAGGVAPTLTATAGKVDIFVFETINPTGSGSVWYGSLVGNNF